MGRVTTTWRCILLMIFFLYIHPQVDSARSDQTPYNASSPNSTELSHQKECSALLQFKNTTYKSCNVISSRYEQLRSTTDSWMEGKDCCSWVGVFCDIMGGNNVIGLDLHNSCLKGTLNLSIFLQLPHLEMLDLSRNSLTGSIPESLSQLEKLSVVHLYTNMLSGKIPDIFSKLRGLYDLDLSGNNFSGPIPRSLCDELRYLDFLSLSDNFLTGGVPSCLFNIPSLSHIDLANNQLTGFTGQFKPTTSELSTLSFGNNKINGPIPSSIFELVNLTFLNLSSNNLNGTLKFDLLPKFRGLELLDLSGNSLLSFSFDGNVNEKDMSSPFLRDLRLSSCNISEFPSFLSYLEELKSLDLSNNRISEFPSSLSSLENLKSLDLSNNRISEFPSSLENLESLDLSNNGIHGQIFKNGSEGWSNLHKLKLSHNFLTYIEHPWENIEFLYLDNNRLQGSLLVPPPRTANFLVSNNNLTGNIPLSFCNLSLLDILDLSGNNLGGEIPKCFESLMIRLNFLHLQNNILQGIIPDIFTNASVLVSLDLSGNSFGGPLPRSSNGCTELQVLNVGNNKISDIFPYWLGTLPNLKILVLKSNRFYGKVFHSNAKFFTLRIFNLSGNKLTGYLSTKFFENMEGMMSTRGWEEQYMGFDCVPFYGIGICGFSEDYIYSVSLMMKGNSIKFERIFKDFRAIDLSNNCFEGNIPEILGKFKSLTMLNLSHNSLIGKIPSSFGNMIALESLDLSSNKLDGRIPKQMESLTFLGVLNLSHNILSGPIPQGGQFSTYESDSFVGNKGLCGKPLLEKCSNDLVPSIPTESLQEEDDVAIQFSWKIVMMGYGCGLVIGLSIGYFVLSTGKLEWLEQMVEGQLHKKVRRPC